MTDALLYCSLASTIALLIVFVVAVVTKDESNKMYTLLGHIAGTIVGLWTITCALAVLT